MPKEGSSRSDGKVYRGGVWVSSCCGQEFCAIDGYGDGADRLPGWAMAIVVLGAIGMLITLGDTLAILARLV